MKRRFRRFSLLSGLIVFTIIFTGSPLFGMIHPCTSRDDRSRLDEYAPVLYLFAGKKDDQEREEEYRPVGIDAMLEEAEIKSPTGESHTCRTPECLMRHNNKKFYLDLYDASGSRPPTMETKRKWRRDHNEAEVYGRCAKLDDGRIVLQYWFFYLYNEGTNVHPGDWEMVQLILDQAKNPQYITYSRHYDAKTYKWTEIAKSSSTHPAVLVGLGSHASFEMRDYVVGGKQWKILQYRDDVSTKGPVLCPKDIFDASRMPRGEAYKLTPFPETPEKENWTFWRGKWGEPFVVIPLLRLPWPSGSPGSPGRDQRWNEPVEWAEYRNEPTYPYLQYLQRGF